MIKIITVLAVLCGISAGYSIPVQNAFMYYQQPMGASRQSLYGIHYQNQQLRNPGRSAAVSAFAAGNTIATGTYLKDCHDDDTDDLPADDQNVQTVADAHPEEQIPSEDAPEDDVPAVQEVDEEDAVADEPAAASPVAPAVATDKKKKKVPAQVDSDEDEEQDSPVTHRGGSRPAAPNAFFPISFGGTNGDIIAIANSYSTGKDGSAISSASAYGSSVDAELRKTPVQLKKKAAKVRARQH